MNSKVDNWIAVVIGTVGYILLVNTPWYLVGSLAAIFAGACLSNLITFRFPQTGKTSDWLIPSIFAGAFCVGLFILSTLSLIPGVVLTLTKAVLVIGAITSLAQLYRFIGLAISKSK